MRLKNKLQTKYPEGVIWVCFLVIMIVSFTFRYPQLIRFPQFEVFESILTPLLCSAVDPSGCSPFLMCIPPTAEQALLRPNYIRLFLLLLSMSYAAADVLC